MNDIREAPRGVTIQPGRHAGPSLNREGSTRSRRRRYV